MLSSLLGEQGSLDLLLIPVRRSFPPVPKAGGAGEAGEKF